MHFVIVVIVDVVDIVVVTVVFANVVVVVNEYVSFEGTFTRFQ